MLPKHFPHALVILHMFFRNCRLAVKVFTLDIVIGHFGSEVFSRNGKRGQEIKPTATGLIPLVNVLPTDASGSTSTTTKLQDPWWNNLTIRGYDAGFLVPEEEDIPPDCLKSLGESRKVCTPIQGRQRILNPHWGYFYF